MDPLGNPLTTRPIHTGWEISMKSCPNWRLRFIDNPDSQFVDGSILTWTLTQSDIPEMLIKLAVNLAGMQAGPSNVPESQLGRRFILKKPVHCIFIHRDGLQNEDLLACKHVIWILFLTVGACAGYRGITMEGITEGQWDMLQMLDRWAESRCRSGQQAAPKGILV